MRSIHRVQVERCARCDDMKMQPRLPTIVVKTAYDENKCLCSGFCVLCDYRVHACVNEHGATNIFLQRFFLQHRVQRRELRWRTICQQPRYNYQFEDWRMFSHQIRLEWIVKSGNLSTIIFCRACSFLVTQAIMVFFAERLQL